MRAFLGMGGVCLAIGLGVLASPRDAAACGGCFHEPSQQTVSTVVTDHRMAFTVSKTSTTLYDQIRYMGDPSKFAWMLPIAGDVSVGLSADVMFASLDPLTQTTINAPFLAPCPRCPATGQGLSCGGSASSLAFPGANDRSADGGAAEDSGVQITKREVVGPYETVQLKATDPMSISTWLIANGFEIPIDVKPIIEAYQAEGFGFLALKLLPGKGVSSMRPVRVTTAGAGLGLPLRMVSAGTGANVGITLWVIGEGRYEPTDFPSFRITADDLVWDWGVGSSNYATLRQEKTAASKGFGWEIESSTDVSRARLEDLVLSGGTRFGTSPASDDYDPVMDPQNPQNDKTAEEVRTADLDTVFGGLSLARVTRMRADLARAALGKDLHLGASSDQSELSNVRNLTRYTNRPVCPVCPNQGLGGGGGCSEAANGASDLGLLFAAAFVGMSALRRRRQS